jgi:hypothetical protein
VTFEQEVRAALDVTLQEENASPRPLLARRVTLAFRALWKSAGGFSTDTDWRVAKKAAVAALRGA